MGWVIPWARTVDVTLSGIAHELTPLNPDPT